MGEIITTVFILMASQSVPNTPDPQQEVDYRRCTPATTVESGYLSPE